MEIGNTICQAISNSFRVATVPASESPTRCSSPSTSFGCTRSSGGRSAWSCTKSILPAPRLIEGRMNFTVEHEVVGASRLDQGLRILVGVLHVEEVPRAAGAAKHRGHVRR